jgi:hypothetical protein
MTITEEIFIEEMLLAFLRSNKKVALTEIEKKEGCDKNEYKLSFKIDKDFSSPISSTLDKNQFSEFFNSKKESKK